MSCTTNLIGVTNSEAIPFYDELGAELKTDIAAGTTDLFMDALTGGVDLNTIDEQGDMEEILGLALKGKDEAEKIFNDDLVLALSARYKTSRDNFTGVIGRVPVSQTLATTGTLQAMRLRAHAPIGGNIVITKISLNVNTAATFNVYVGRTNKRDKALLEPKKYTFPITTAVSMWTQVDMSAESNRIELPMEIEGLAQEWWIWWDREEAGGASPKNNELSCHCSSDPLHKALQFMDIHGASFNDTAVVNTAKADLYARGISIEAQIGCDINMIVCREYDKSPAIKAMTKWALLYKAGELWIEYILKSGRVSKTMLQGREYMWGKRNNFRAEYDKRITKIADSMNLDDTNCYTCRNDRVMKVGIKS